MAVRRPSEAVTVTVRLASVPASGSGAVNRASVYAVCPGGTWTWPAAQPTLTTRSGSVARSSTWAHSAPRRLSTTTRTRPEVASRTRTRLGSTSRVTIGSSALAVVDCCSVTVVSTRWSPSCAVMVSGRVISWPGSGPGAVAATRTDPLCPGATSSIGGSKRNETASSGSMPANRTRAKRLLRALSTTTVKPAVSRSRTRSSEGSARSPTGASMTGTVR